MPSATDLTKNPGILGNLVNARGGPAVISHAPELRLPAEKCEQLIAELPKIAARPGQGPEISAACTDSSDELLAVQDMLELRVDAFASPKHAAQLGLPPPDLGRMPTSSKPAASLRSRRN